MHIITITNAHNNHELLCASKVATAKINIASKWASKHLRGYHLFCCLKVHGKQTNASIYCAHFSYMIFGNFFSDSNYS